MKFKLIAFISCIYPTKHYYKHVKHTAAILVYTSVYAIMHVCIKLAVNWKNLKASVRDVYFGKVSKKNLKNTAIKYKMASKKTH